MKLCPKCQKQFSDDANFCPVDAARLVPIQAQATGTDALSGRFDLGARLGGGQTGAVHRAVDKTTGGAVAVKLISPKVIALPGVAQRIERELKQLERVQSVGVAHVLASGKRGDEFWVATELLEGAQTLAQSISARGPLPPEQAADLVELIGEALIEAAQVGVVHRDLAPKNVLFAGSDIKLINFSLPVPASDKVPGVPEFVAPEQVDGRPVDQRSNLYSLGALYYYVLTGQTLFAGSPEDVLKQHQTGTIRSPSQIVQVPGGVEAVIMRALDRSPTKRFLTVRQFVDEVTRVGHGEVIELKQTMAMGKAGARPKGELVQTLLGVRGQFGAAGLPISQAPTAAVKPVAPPPAPAPAAAPAAHSPASTVLGIPQSGHMAQATSQSPAGMPPTPASGGPSGDRSPWASPGAAAKEAPPVAAPTVAQTPAAPPYAPAPTPQVAAPVVAAPAAPVVAAPQVASPQVAAAPSGKRKAADDGSSKGKFRETMWFKKGDLDAQAAQAAAEERARTGKDVAADKADSLPIDERYKDDGTISRSDKEKYSLRTGGTQAMPAIRGGTGANASMNKVSEDALIGEMKKGRSKIIVAILLAVAAIIAIVYMVAS